MHTERGRLPREVGNMRHSGQHVAAILRQGKECSSPPSAATHAQVVGLNAAFGVLVVPERWSQRYQ